MASPNFDALSVRLSQKMNDAVASAASDGDRFTSAKRTEFLNNGHRAWMRMVVNGNIALRANGQYEDWGRLRGYMTLATGTISASLKIVTSGFSPQPFYVLGVFNTTDHVDVQSIPKGRTRIDIQYETNSLRTAQHWDWDSGDIYVINSTSGDGYAIQYIKEHSDLSAGGSTDTLVPAEFFDEVLDEAYKIFCNEDPDNLNTARLMVGK